MAVKVTNWSTLARFTTQAGAEAYIARLTPRTPDIAWRTLALKSGRVAAQYATK